MSQERNPAVDIAKTIGIALVVFGHISGNGESAWLGFSRNLIYQFHVPLFFFLSGFCFKQEESWKVFLIKKFHRLYLPFLFWNLIFFAIHIIAHTIAGDSIILTDTIKHFLKIVFGIAITPLGGATWFLIKLFQSLLLYKILLTIYRRLSTTTQPSIILLVSLLIGLFGNGLYLPWGLDKSLVALPFVAVGHQVREHPISLHISPCFKSLILLLGGLMLIGGSMVNRPDMSLHEYGIIPIYWGAAFIGIFSTLLLSDLVSRKCNLLAKWGQCTLAILIGHFTGFKLVTILQIWLCNQPWRCIFSHPCHYVNGWWPLFYFIAGFFIPLLIDRGKQVRMQHLFNQSIDQ